jgi:hypothetical protein
MPDLSYTLPKYNSAIIRLIADVKKGLELTDPILSQIRTIRSSHGGAIRQVSQPKVLETEMQEFSVEGMVEADWFFKTNVDGFVKFMLEFNESFNSQIKKQLFESVSQITDATGNIVDGKGKNFWDSYIEMINKVEMYFDENGEHNYQIYINPETAKKLEGAPPTKEQIGKIESAISSKRDEYNAKKRTRRLS